MNRKNIENIVEKLDELCKVNYNEFEVALMIWLRCDLFGLKNYITDSDLEEIGEIVNSFDSILNEDLKCDIDNILEETLDCDNEYEVI